MHPLKFQTLNFNFKSFLGRVVFLESWLIIFRFEFRFWRIFLVTCFSNFRAEFSINRASPLSFNTFTWLFRLSNSVFKSCFSLDIARSWAFNLSICKHWAILSWILDTFSSSTGHSGSTLTSISSNFIVKESSTSIQSYWSTSGTTVPHSRNLTDENFRLHKISQ